MSNNKPDVSEFGSVDPAPPSENSGVLELRNTLCDEDERMFQRIGALFALRNIVVKKRASNHWPWRLSHLLHY